MIVTPMERTLRLDRGDLGSREEDTVDIPRPQKNRRRKAYVYGALGMTALVVITVAIGHLGPAAPSVSRGTVFTDSVQRGTMLVQVRGPGTLVPEQIRWISAVTAGRIERKLVQPGTIVDPSTILVRMSNPDVELQALEADRQLTAAQADLVNLRSTLETQRLNQKGVIATVEAQLADAQRSVMAAESLAQRQLVSNFELETARGRAKEMETRVGLEHERLRVMEESMQGQVSNQESQVERMKAIVAFQRQRLAAMEVRAGTRGVLQDLPLEEGQWVQSGQTLAKVVQPDRLKAVLRIPEVQARDVTLGQPAQIDTRSDTIPGHVMRIDPASQNGTVAVDVALDVDSLPRGARPDLSVDGTIEIARLEDALFVGRPAFGQAQSAVQLFKLVDNGSAAVRVTVRLGLASVNSVQILDGLAVGDMVILSDMSQWDNVDRVRLR
jgi:HlyD family secretion protein